MDLFENRSVPVEYAIRAKSSGCLESACIHDFYAAKTEEDAYYTAAHPFYGEIEYTMSQSDKVRRVAYKISFTEETKVKNKTEQICLIPHVFAVITNIQEGNSEHIIDFYCARATSENFTKELKDDFGGNTLSHRGFTANALEFLLKSLAYNLYQMLRVLVLEGRDALMTCNSFRKKYQKVGARVIRHARSYGMSISRAFRYRKQFMRYLQRARTDWKL